MMTVADRPRSRLHLEPLEDRSVPATFSIADITVTEGVTSIGLGRISGELGEWI